MPPPLLGPEVLATVVGTSEGAGPSGRLDVRVGNISGHREARAAGQWACRPRGWRSGLPVADGLSSSAALVRGSLSKPVSLLSVLGVESTSL